MSDLCRSTLICADRDKDIFEQMGYTVEEAIAESVFGEELVGARVMFTREAPNGNYDTLTKLKGIPFIVCNGSCSGVFGDHLIASDGTESRYSEALHESNYPAVRVEPEGLVRPSELEDAYKYWVVYSGAIAAIRTVPPIASTSEQSANLA
jgi:hypothetical protein